MIERNMELYCIEVNEIGGKGLPHQSLQPMSCISGYNVTPRKNPRMLAQEKLFNHWILIFDDRGV